MAIRAATPASWKPGQSGNPAGAKPVVKHIQELARAHTAEAVQALVDALKSKRERVAAAMGLLAYGYGKPIQTMNVRKITTMADLSEEELLALANSEVPPTPEIEGEAQEVVH